ERVGGSVPGEFVGCDASTDFVRISTRPSLAKFRKSPKPPAKLRFSIELSRGKIDVPTAKSQTKRGTVPFVHSTHLQNCAVKLNGWKLQTQRSLLTSPAILLPRVGNPSPNKVALYTGRKRIALSDCVIAMHGLSIEKARVLHARLIAQWPTI